MKKQVRLIGCYPVKALHEALSFHIENKHMLSMVSVEESDLTHKCLQTVQYNTQE